MIDLPIMRNHQSPPPSPPSDPILKRDALALVSTGSALSQLRAGKIRGLAVSGTKRLSAFPDIPTFAEAGLPEFSVSNWSGLAAPAGTPAEIVSKLHEEVRRALASPDMKEFLESLGA